MALSSADAEKWLQVCLGIKQIQHQIDNGPAQTASLAAHLAALPNILTHAQAAQATVKAALLAAGASEDDLSAVAQ